MTGASHPYLQLTITDIDFLFFGKVLLYPVTVYGIDTSVIEINRSLALTRNNLNIITITHTMYLR